MSNSAAVVAPIRTTIPARLDRLGWSPFHTRMVAGLGAAWILDGLQITIASSVTGVLTQPDNLVGAGIMIIGGIVEVLVGINAEGKSLEDITKPLTAAAPSPAVAAGG